MGSLEPFEKIKGNTAFPIVHLAMSSQTFHERLHFTYNGFCVALGRVIVMPATKKTISLFLEVYSRHPSSILSLTTSLEIKFV